MKNSHKQKRLQVNSLGGFRVGKAMQGSKDGEGEREGPHRLVDVKPQAVNVGQEM